MQIKILLLEDDISLSDTITQYLTHLGYGVLQAYDAHEAEDLLYENQVDMMLLDINVPYQNGVDLLGALRAQGVQTPAIFITSLHSVDDVTRGFDAGCDDYIRKPFALGELKVRIEAVLKRQIGSHSAKIPLPLGRFFDPQNLILYEDDHEIKLTLKEAKLLKLFLLNPNILMTKQVINDTLWEYHEEPNEGSLRTYIKVLRGLLGKEAIRTVKNLGYRYVS